RGGPANHLHRFSGAGGRKALVHFRERAGNRNHGIKVSAEAEDRLNSAAVPQADGSEGRHQEVSGNVEDVDAISLPPIVIRKIVKVRLTKASQFYLRPARSVVPPQRHSISLN